jgi:hypothetical protein
MKILLIISLNVVYLILALTEKLLVDTELQLEILEEKVKDSNLEKQMNEYTKKMVLLKEQKYAEFEHIKSMPNINVKYIFTNPF